MKYKNEFEKAKQIIIEAGKALMQLDQKEIEAEIGKDIKLKADQETEEKIVNALKAEFSWSILSEESGELGNFTYEDPAWILDPIDGTHNFSRSLYLCCISLAFWHQDQPVFGLVYDFNHNQLYSGYVGEGAWCNDAPIQTSNIVEIDKASLVTGFPIYRDFGASSLQETIRQIQLFKKIRCLGTAALSMAFVASGKADAYMEEDIMLWDVAAGIAITKAAGGFISYKHTAKSKWALNVKAFANQKLSGGFDDGQI